MPKSPSAKKLLTATGLLCAIFAVSTPFWLFTSEQSVSVVNKNKVSTKDAATKVDSITPSKDSDSHNSSDKVSKADIKAKNKDSDKANTADTKAKAKDSDKAQDKASDKVNDSDTNNKESDKVKAAESKTDGKDAQGKTSNKESAAINEAKSKSSGEDKFATAAVEKDELSESVLSEGQSIAQKPQSLADKVRDITNMRTAEDKAAYERAIKEREQQVDDAIASISGNYKIYLPNMFSEKAVVIYFSAPVSSTKINLRKDADLSKLKIDSLSGATQVKYQDQDTFQDVSEPAMDYIANTLSKESGAQLFKVATVTTYPDNVSKLYSMSFDELSNSEYPELTDDVLLNIDEYSVIYLCYPNWWGNMPGAIYSFLAKYDLSDKIIVPVCLYEKDKFSGTTDTIATIEPNASVYSKGLLISKEECKNESNMRSKIRTFLTELSKEFE